MEFLLDYLGFLAKTATIVGGVLLVVFTVAGLSAQRALRPPPTGHIEVVRVNDRLQDMTRAVEEATLSPRAARKQRKRDAKARKKPSGEGKRVFVLNFHGDLEANGVEGLRQEVSAVLGTAREQDEVLVRVDSAGGAVTGYGLAASQLARVRKHGCALTVAVDKVAASGGYMVAAVANRILAAPFAVVGSIGVVAQIPNFHRLLKRHDVDMEVHTAGRFKRTLDMLGENTEQGREKLREELHDIHALFQEFVGAWRPSLDIEAVATGEAWHGQRALDRALVDELMTSDEYLAQAAERADVFEVSWVAPKRPIERVLEQLSEFATRMARRLPGGAVGAATLRTPFGIGGDASR